MKNKRPFGAGPRDLPKVHLERKFLRVESEFKRFRELVGVKDYGQAEHVLRKLKKHFDELFPVLIDVEKTETEFKQHKGAG